MTEKLQNPFEIGELITAVNSTIDDVNEKQDTLIAGTNVTIENNVISAKGSIDNVDGVTAIVNEDDILQVTGMLEKNAGDAVFDWVGTREEYNSQNLANTHPDWICFITDDAQDTSNLLEQVNTVKNELTTKADTTTVNNLVYPIGTNNWNNAEQWIHNVLSTLYPVGAIYIGTQNTCPLVSLISGSQWQLVAQDRALWGGNGSNGNTTIAAGLPNITGTFSCTDIASNSHSYTGIGAFRNQADGTAPYAGGGGNPNTYRKIDINASRSSSIYGNSNTVQPPAYRVNVWRRTA